jgi:hypothetical protein
MKFFVSILFALFLSSAACGFQRDVTIRKYEIQNVIDPQFPVEKDVIIAKAELKYPDVYFFKGDHLGMKLQYTGRFLKKPAEGQIDLRGSLIYKPEKGALYLSKIEIVDFSVNKESRPNKDKLQGTLEAILSDFIVTIPIYRLKQKDFKEDLAKLQLKKIRVENENLILTVGR